MSEEMGTKIYDGTVTELAVLVKQKDKDRNKMFRNAVSTSWHSFVEIVEAIQQDLRG